MANACPVPGPDDPLVRSLLGVVDCNTQSLVHSGYSALFQSAGPFSSLLTAMLTLYVGFIGYRLMLGQSQMRVTEFCRDRREDRRCGRLGHSVGHLPGAGLPVPV